MEGRKGGRGEDLVSPFARDCVASIDLPFKSRTEGGKDGRKAGRQEGRKVKKIGGGKEGS